MSDLVTLTIDEQQVQVPKGTLLVEAAKQAGIDIPVFCYHSRLKPVGACRMCLVEIEKMPRLQTACTSPVSEGMVVHTNTPNVESAQNGVLEFLLANHPLDCPICDKGGECPLQDNTFRFGRGVSRFYEVKRKLQKAIPLSERIVLDRERCIMCYRCVRFQDEIAGDQALAVIDRGGMSQIGVLDGDEFDSPFSGNTVDICPVGALLSRQYRFQARPWDLRREPSICVGCAVGCNIELHSRDGQLKRMVPRENPKINDVWLCDFGRFDTLPFGVERIRVPAIDGEPASWDAALRSAVDLLLSAPVEVVASPSLTNEALHSLNTISRTLQAPLSVWPQLAGRVRGDISGLLASKSIVLAGFDPWEQLPVLALRIREAVRHGARLYLVGNGFGALKRDAYAQFHSVEQLLGAASQESSGALPGPVSILGPEAARLAEQLGDGGMIGQPALAANGYAVQALPGARFEAQVLLLAGNEPWPDASLQRNAVRLRWEIGNKVALGDVSGGVRALSGPPARSKRDVLLPIAHPYEQTGTVTNFEGIEQSLTAGGLAPADARADWLALEGLAEMLKAALAANSSRERALV